MHRFLSNGEIKGIGILGDRINKLGEYQHKIDWVCKKAQKEVKIGERDEEIKTKEKKKN